MANEIHLGLQKASHCLNLDQVSFVQELKVLWRRKGTVLGKITSNYGKKVSTKDKGL